MFFLKNQIIENRLKACFVAYFEIFSFFRRVLYKSFYIKEFEFFQHCIKQKPIKEFSFLSMCLSQDSPFFTDMPLNFI